MVLVYDGGHSMQEVMWTGNQCNEALGLGLGWAERGDPRAFLADYDKFVDSHAPDTRRWMAAAMDRAWQATQDHHDRHSHFSTQPSRASGHASGQAG